MEKFHNYLLLRTLSFRNLGIDLLKYSFFVVKMTPSHLVRNLFCIKDFCINKTTFFNVPKCFDGPLSSSVSYSVKLPLNVEGVHCYKVRHIAYLKVYINDVKRHTGRDVIIFSVTYCEIAIEF